MVAFYVRELYDIQQFLLYSVRYYPIYSESLWECFLQKSS